MSKNADRDSAGSDEREQEDPENLLARLTEIAKKAAARCGVPDYREDIAQSAFEELWRHRQRTAERVSDSTVSAMVMRFAREERRRRRERGPTTNDADERPSSESKRRKEALESKAVSLGTPLRPAASFVPTLCPILHGMISGTEKAQSIEILVLGACAVLARDRRVVTRDQNRMFDLGYVHGRPAKSITARFKLNKRTVRERLRRISDLIETALLRAMESKTPPDEWSRIAPAILSATLDQKSGRVGARLSSVTSDLLAVAVGRVSFKVT